MAPDRPLPTMTTSASWGISCDVRAYCSSVSRSVSQNDSRRFATGRQGGVSMLVMLRHADTVRVRKAAWTRTREEYFTWAANRLRPSPARLRESGAGTCCIATYRRLGSSAEWRLWLGNLIRPFIGRSTTQLPCEHSAVCTSYSMSLSPRLLLPTAQTSSQARDPSSPSHEGVHPG
jgi:hypothetical protein